MPNNPAPETAPLSGLTEQEAQARRAAGHGNAIPIQTSRRYLDILRDNVFILINWVFLAISLVLASLGRYGDISVIVLIISSNTLVNLVQEVRAKWQLDKIALLTRPQATVIRAGQAQQLDPSEIVMGDILVARPGDQIVVDGTVRQGRMQVDEALLTGEADLIRKQPSDMVYSGSFCVTGEARYEAQKVGADSLAQTITSGAKAFRQRYTPLQQEINLITRLLLLVAIILGLLTWLTYLVGPISLDESIQRAAVIAGLVPAGLYLMITLAYSLGALRIVKQDALIQQANAIESLSNVDVLCLDKTGTLTANQITLHELFPIGLSEARLQALLGDYAASSSGGNRTIEAIMTACAGKPQTNRLEIPFSSAYKWSGLAFDDPPQGGLYVLGAPEVLAEAAPLDGPTQQQLQAGLARGWRMLLFAHCPHVPEIDPDQPHLPPKLTPLGLLAFKDVLRPHVEKTLADFAAAEITLKLISGDNPHTVAAAAKQVGLTGELISGPELAQLSDLEFSQAAQTKTIFGRVTPAQKSQLIQSLRHQGHYVAMIGDGVNDVLSLKQANLGIALESGSQITRSVADMILLRDSFGALPYAFQEGQRIRNGIYDVVKIFMVRIISVTLLIIALGMVTSSFPFFIKHNTVVAFLTVGLPTFGLTFWAKAGRPPQERLILSLIHFVLPAVLTVTAVGVGVYLGYASLTNQAMARTALVAAFIFTAPFLLPLLKPPTPAWTGGAPLSGDWRYLYLALSMVAIFLVVMLIPPMRLFFDLAMLHFVDYLLLSGVAIAWGGALRTVWRWRLLERFLGGVLHQLQD